MRSLIKPVHVYIENLRPQIADRVGSAELEAYIVIDFITPRRAVKDPVFLVDCVLLASRYVPYRLARAGNADGLGGDSSRHARSLGRVGE